MVKELQQYLGPGYVQEAFNLHEIKEPLNWQAFLKRVESYLGEYRFQLPKYFYEYWWTKNQGLVDPDTNESMITKGQRALEKMESLGKGEREKAELKGLHKLNQIIDSAQVGDIFVWASPPGEKEDGYGDYGFFFLGIVDSWDGEKKHISMVARRVDENGRNLDYYNSVLSGITGQSISFQKTEDFLAHPVLSKVEDPEKIIDSYFGKIDDSFLDRFDLAREKLTPLIARIFDLLMKGSLKEARRLFNVVENFSIDLYSGLFLEKNAILDLLDPRIIDFYSYKPPTVYGSCGGSDSSSDSELSFIKTANILNELSFLESSFWKLLKNNADSDEYGSLTFFCPACGEIHRRPYGELLKNCPKTGKEIPKC